MTKQQWTPFDRLAPQAISTNVTRTSDGFLQGAVVRNMFADIGKTTLHRWVKEELLVPPVAIGPHRKGFPAAETRQIISARMAGASAEQVRNLVRQLVLARTQRPDRGA